MIPKMICAGEHVTLRHCKTDKFKAGMLSVSLVLPIERKSAYMTSLLLSVLLRGTEKYPSIAALNRRLDYLYGAELSIRNFYRGDAQIVGLSASFVDGSYLPQKDAGKAMMEDILEVVSQILFHPVRGESGFFDERYVESEKKLQCDTIRAQKNNPHAYAGARMRAHLFENEPCGAPLYGTEEEVMRVTPAELWAHWETLLRTMHLHCFYIGSADGEAVAHALSNAFDGELAHAAVTPVPRVIGAYVPVGRETRYVEEELDVGQGQLVMGFRTDAAEDGDAFYACALFNELLGTSPVSKLFMNVREKLSLCYSCNSVYNFYKNAITVACGLENGNRTCAEEEILRCIGAIAAGEISDEEWLAAKKSLENAYRQLEDSPAALESFYFGRALAGFDVSLEECRARLAATRREDVCAVAAALRPDVVFFLRSTGNGEEDEYEED